jgi:peptidoglycan L-alanyl-D-glutamate endopeptidase CwlK
MCPGDYEYRQGFDYHLWQFVDVWPWWNNYHKYWAIFPTQFYSKGVLEMSNKIADLKQPARDMATESGRLLKLAGIPYVDTSTLRTDAEQIALHAQGREPLDEVNRLRKIAGMRGLPAKENNWTVTNCDGVKTKSNHQSGLAVDRVPADAKGNPIWPHPSDPRWMQIATVMEACGFKWGGRWTKEKDGIDPDMPHYEMRGV